MSTTTLKDFQVIGLAIKTSNIDGASGQDIPQLWNTFLANKTMEKIPNRIGNEVLCIYTEYEGDHTKPYTALLGCKVSNLEEIPEGMRGMSFPAGNYVDFVAKGNLMEGIVWQEWAKIWQSDLDRTFVADFEVYGEKTQNPTDAEVAIYVGVR